MPDTTPIANETAKILVQKRARRCRCSRPVAIQRTSNVAMKADSPMVKLGKMMWNITVKANWRRANRTGSRSIGHSPAGWRRESNRGGCIFLHVGAGRQQCKRRSRDPCQRFVIAGGGQMLDVGKRAVRLRLPCG